MLPGTLIHLIEAHRKELTARILRELWRNPDLLRMQQKLPEAELRERIQILLEHFTQWLTSGNEEKLARQQEAVGALRYEQAIPLHETVRALCLMKYNLISFVEEQDLPSDSIALYAEEELEHRIGRFFDLLIIHLVRGYELAWHRAAQVAV